MLLKKICSIISDAHQNMSSQQRYVAKLTDIYKTEGFEAFSGAFVVALQKLIHQPNEKNPYVSKALMFCAKFCGSIAILEEQKDGTQEFLSKIIEETLKYHNTVYVNMRVNSCRFLTLLLSNIGKTMQLENDICDLIQNAMLERIQDRQAVVRQHAADALVRLQDTANPNCPVYKAYLDAIFYKGPAHLREKIIANIALTQRSVQEHLILTRVIDVDASVRRAAYLKFSDCSPNMCRIADRHFLLTCGFREQDPQVKKVFIDTLIPQWLTCYEGDFLGFLGALKLTTDWEDLEEMMTVSEPLLKLFYDKYPIADLLEIIPLSHEKVAPTSKLNVELVYFWRVLTKLLRESENMEEYVSAVLPELTIFSQYIERYVKEMPKESDEFKFLEFQFNLLNLLEMAEEYDLSDEVGKAKLHSLVLSILTGPHLRTEIIKKLVEIAYKCDGDLETFTTSMCQVISDIKEPLVEEPLSQADRREHEMNIARITVRKHELHDEIETALANRDYAKSQLLENQLKNCMAELEKKEQALKKTEKVKVQKNDAETTSQCLDVLGGTLILEGVTKLTPALITCKDLFLLPLITTSADETHWRVLKCLGLMALFDRDVAVNFGKVLAIPVATYRTVRRFDVRAMCQSIIAVTNLLRIYGPELFVSEEAPTSEQNTTKRRLYNAEDTGGDDSVVNNDSTTLYSILGIFVDMLDDDHDEIRQEAASGLGSLLVHFSCLTGTLLSRIILKWANPMTVRQDTKLQMLLGMFVEELPSLKNSIDGLKESLIPTLTAIVEAPKTSPVADIDIDGLLQVYAALSSTYTTTDSCKYFALDIFIKINDDMDERLLIPLTKLLCYLRIEVKDVQGCPELIERSESLLEKIPNGVARKNIEKFISNLKKEEAYCRSRNTTVASENTNINTDISTSAQPPTPDTSIRVSSPSNQQVKRKKNRKPSSSSLNVERNSVIRDTLNTIEENAVEENGVEDNMNIETPSTSTNSSQETGVTPNTIVTRRSTRACVLSKHGSNQIKPNKSRISATSETSDSDESLRKSKRNK